MGSRGRPFFDLNEPPAEEDEESNVVPYIQPKKALPSSSASTSNLFGSSGSSQGLVNNNAFSHASSVSGFQPFVRSKDVHNIKENVTQKAGDSSSNHALPSTVVNCRVENKLIHSVTSNAFNAEAVEREEGEWSDMEGSADALGNNASGKHEEMIECNGEVVQKQGVSEITDISGSEKASEGFSCPADHMDVKDKVVDNVKLENNPTSFGSEPQSYEQTNNSNKNPEDIKGEVIADVVEDSSSVFKQKDVKGVEASHALKCANNPGKKHKLDQHKEAMLGKKRSRQTVFLNLEDIKQAGPIKSSTPRRQTFSSPMITRTVKENRVNALPSERTGERQVAPVTKDSKQVDEGSTPMEFNDHKAEPNGDANAGLHVRSKKLNSGADFPVEVCLPPVPRQGSLKQLTESRQSKNQQLSTRKTTLVSQNREPLDTKSGNKKHHPTKKQNVNNSQYQDTSVERLIREVTNEKFWHQAEETELQCVPGRFESVEEYVRVFEPLLFEECRAQLHSTWEEFTETVSRDAHIMVRIKHVERRERGWYDVIVLPTRECKWTFKEGDVAILSKPGPARSKRISNASANEDDPEAEVTGRVAGTVRRHSPIDTRDPMGAILHFYVGDTYDSNSKLDDNHILRKLQSRGTWYLTVLGSLATTQREYIALHAFRRLNLQMQTAILKPSPEHFPKYEEQPPAMPECFTQNFVDHLHRTFNGPQLAAIQWAAMHTAAGTSSSSIQKRQDPWPFTLVQGPPGTGKTHTVWGMLNVIHLVQYQHYYTALLKKLAPESYKQTNESNSESVCTGSIDEVLQSMDQNLFRTLPKLCPKPRMLVCAPSNAATDELLARVLDRGFIDGEMKVYRPDVARVGVDSQTRAAQAVSVERRTEQLLVKGREEIIGWMHQLKAREAQFSQQIAGLQRELNVVAAAGRAQGSVGVDPDLLVAREHNRDALLQNLAAAVEGRDKVLVEMSRLLILEGRFRAGSSFNLEEARANLEASFANEAEIVFTTVSSSGRKLFSRLTHGFDMVVIDEAAQASEVAVLPPLSLGAARCVLVGDPQQLPATVISKAAGTLLYSRSLFERFQQAGCPTMLLSVQYRMHPEIRDFPSRYFYQGRLTDSESVSKLADEIYYKDPLLKPYVFYDVTHGRESHRAGSVSFQNIHEAQFCLRLYEHLQKTLKSLGGNKLVSVGIITPYKLQLKCLQREFEEVLNSEEDIRRMNVALTRARRALWVMGNANALMQSDDWAALISDAKSRNCYADMDSIPKDFLVTKASYTPVPGKNSSNTRGMRMGGPRHRHFDVLPDPKAGKQFEDDDRSNAVGSRNGSYGNLKLPPTENFLDDLEQSGEKSRNAWQYGISSRQNSAGVLKKDS
ncbi:hypothetical protein AAC387_Pa07g0124 [Persea americana]